MFLFATEFCRYFACNAYCGVCKGSSVNLQYCLNSIVDWLLSIKAGLNRIRMDKSTSIPDSIGDS